MTRDEYLNKLEEALTGAVPESVVRENINYYRDYLNGEAANGKSVDEVAAEIGAPSLIARSIISSNEGVFTSGQSSSGSSQSSKNTNSSRGSSSGNYYEDTSGNSSSGGRRSRGFHFGTGSGSTFWRRYGRMLMPLIIMIVFMLFSRVFYYVIFFAFRYAWPVILILLLIWILRRWSRRR